jgi:hypothetical protein
VNEPASTDDVKAAIEGACSPIDEDNAMSRTETKSLFEADVNATLVETASWLDALIVYVATIVPSASPRPCTNNCRPTLTATWMELGVTLAKRLIASTTPDLNADNCASLAKIASASATVMSRSPVINSASVVVVTVTSGLVPVCVVVTEAERLVIANELVSNELTDVVVTVKVVPCESADTDDALAEAVVIVELRSITVTASDDNLPVLIVVYVADSVPVPVVVVVGELVAEPVCVAVSDDDTLVADTETVTDVPVVVTLMLVVLVGAVISNVFPALPSWPWLDE